MTIFDSILLKLPTAFLERMRVGLEGQRAASSGSPRVLSHLDGRLAQVDAALRTRGVPYVLEDEGRAIVCTTCHLKSWHPLDIREKYCGRCHVFHDAA